MLWHEVRGQSRRVAAMLVLAWLAVAGTAPDAWPHGEATGIVKQRMEAMERLEELMDRVFAMLHGELAYDAATMRRAAEEIRASAGREMTALFPEGSLDDPTEARPEI